MHLQRDTPTDNQWILGHQSLTNLLHIHGDVLYSGNADSTIRVWSLTTGALIHTLHGHGSAITSLIVNDKYVARSVHVVNSAMFLSFVFSGSDDGTAKLWDSEKGTFIRNLVDYNSFVPMPSQCISLMPQQV